MAKYLNLKPVEFANLSAKRQAAVQWKGRLMLPKYDGCLALVYIRDGKLDKIVSRDNKPVRSMDHIFADLCLRYPWVTEVPFACFLGEAWIPGRTFAELSGMFRRHSPQHALGFAPFDFIAREKETGELYSPLSYARRLEWLTDSRPGLCAVHAPTPVECEDEAHAWRYANYLKKLGGYDGAVVSDPDAPYVVSDGYGEFLKIKPLQSFSLEVVAVVAAVGDKTGRTTCALMVRFKDTACGVGTGFSNEQAARWVASPSLIVGTIIEVACMGVYDGPLGMMREPRFVGVRDDVIKADY